MKRRDLLRAGAALPGLAAGTALQTDAKKNDNKKKDAPKRSLSGMNVLVFITDQQRAIMHFPKNWAAQNLPGAERLRKNGLTFTQATCNSCMCSPSRATLLTGYLPAQHGVKYTLEEDMPSPQYPQVELPLDLPNIATVTGAAGYSVPFKGKWHLSKPLGADWAPEDVNRYGFQRWNPPDAGANQDIDQFGGGFPNNDGRFTTEQGVVQAGDEGVFEYLNSVAAQQQPFFMIVSLVNPHDVLSYPKNYIDGGYSPDDLSGNIDLPKTVYENLLESGKPRAQAALLALMAIGLGPLTDDQMKRDYLNFYGNLMKESDAYLVQILDTLEAQGLLDNTLVIQTSDHGEMGMAHGGLRQKSFNFYEETLRVPLVFSNRRLFSKARTSNALVSHVDFLPTMASLLGVPDFARSFWQGQDYSRIVLDPDAKAVQGYTVFTYDDFQTGQASGPYVPPPNHIISIREERYKLAKYYDVNGAVPDEWEMYDLEKDPLETKNIAAEGFKRNKEQKKALRRLQNTLAAVEATRLQPL
ncbi:MAG: sulfatase-like hydrolase/transferase [Chloroflexi bacterium]|nr:sulfatase-like hydrolase/transferase [Chloroflexota bacterium]